MTERLKAGLELDAAVCDALGIAPEVFYDASTSDGASYMDTFTRRDAAEDWVAHMKSRYGAQYESLAVVERKSYPRVSEWIQDAWMVVERMRELHGFGFCLGVNGMASPKNDQVGACFFEGFIGAGRLTYSPIASDEEGCGATSGTAAHAICLAALDALVQLPLNKGALVVALPHRSEGQR